MSSAYAHLNNIKTVVAEALQEALERGEAAELKQMDSPDGDTTTFLVGRSEGPPWTITVEVDFL